ncbi:MAG: DUF6573 family protein [Steroidobacteraceae bacterium]
MPALAVRQDGPESFWDGAEVVYSYTRAQAIEDGVLVDASKLASEYGVRYPVAVTRALWDSYVTPPAALAGWQDETGRAWDVLTMFRLAARAGGQEIRFRVLFQMQAGRPARLVELKAVCGPGDDAEPVVTIMLPDED